MTQPIDFAEGEAPAILLALRQRLDMSQPIAADALGIPLGTLRTWEHGRSPPAPDGTFRRACQWLAAGLGALDPADTLVPLPTKE